MRKGCSSTRRPDVLHLCQGGETGWLGELESLLCLSLDCLEIFNRSHLLFLLSLPLPSAVPVLIVITSL